MLVVLLLYSQYWERTGGSRIERDPLNKKIFSLGKNCCSWWPITHFVFYLFLGYWFPSCGWELFLIGVGWEGFEEGMALLNGRESSTSLSEETQYSKSWWGGSLLDIVFNTAGFFVGYGIRSLLHTTTGGPLE